MHYTVEFDYGVVMFDGEPHMPFREILNIVSRTRYITFPLRINGYKVLERDNLDRTLPVEY